MKAIFTPCTLRGAIDAPPSKSMAHRYLIGAALSGEICTLTGVDSSEDISASIDCLTSLGAKITADGDTVTVNPAGFLKAEQPVLLKKRLLSETRSVILSWCVPLSFSADAVWKLFMMKPC